MIKYRHSAFSNLYLVNGYSEIETENGIERMYESEEALEQCIRRIVLRKPSRLRGWDIRFLRRGLRLSQAELGNLVGRDGQTIARWEKNNDEVPQFLDLAVRARFSAQFEPKMTTAELLTYVDGKAPIFPEKILLMRVDYKWIYFFTPQFKVTTTDAGKSVAYVSSFNRAPVVVVYENYTKTLHALKLHLRDNDPKVEGQDPPVYVRNSTAANCTVSTQSLTLH